MYSTLLRGEIRQGLPTEALLLGLPALLLFTGITQFITQFTGSVALLLISYVTGNNYL